MTVSLDILDGNIHNSWLSGLSSTPHFHFPTDGFSIPFHLYKKEHLMRSAGP
jgi:hypothetical protein